MTLDSQIPTYVVGHLNPDTDAICAAIGQAEYLRKAENIDAVPIRCGEVPTRVSWVLEQAGMEAPKLVTDVRTTAELICDKDFVSVSESDTFYSVYRAMQTTEVKSVPVVSESGEIRGILKFTELMQLLMPDEMSSRDSVRSIQASQRNICATLSGDSVGALLSDEEEDLVMFVGASSKQTTKDSILESKEAGINHKQIVICGDRQDIQLAAVQTGVRSLIVTGGYSVSDEVIVEAKAHGVVVILSRFDTATTVQLVRCSRSVSNALGDEFLCVQAGDAVSDIRKCLSAAQQDLFPVVKNGRHLVGVFRKAALVDPPATTLVLVDHNEYAQAVKGVEEANVVEVIDHHRLGGDITSREPIRFLNEPVGSSSTLVARKFRDMNVELSESVAMCLCAGLISDTLNLTSPTTTELDRLMLAWLCEIAGVDAAKFTHDFFASGSLLMKGSAKDLLCTDRKEFNEGGKFLSISQVEEMGLPRFEERIEEMRAELQSLIDQNGYDFAIVAVTDVTQHFSKIIGVGDDRVMAALPFDADDHGVLNAPGVVSRKKQIFPAVSSAIQDAAATALETI
ncbi:putative manganese-dependent inorganic diphosphatase [Rubritalea marina]|uniref:putative manganese-dependent inorganic diphosphatase n=1 Tax=Rubritalea marina TaxID=361055 RepID=UPI0003687965|nr:putative manganese-dependent inorganic diphosphatase [Rubritalea marina]